MAAVEDAGALARSGDLKGALAALRTSNSQLTSSLVALAALARNVGAADAGTLIARALAQDPTDSAARFEQSLQGADAGDLWEHLGHDAERVIEIADLYMHWGLYRDAEPVLQRSYPSFPASELEPGVVPPGSSPLIAYYLGYCEERQKGDPPITSAADRRCLLPTCFRAARARARCSKRRCAPILRMPTSITFSDCGC
jgi:hypothetical protein